MCRFGDAPKSRQPRVYWHPPREGVIRVPGCSWKATAQVTPTISQGTFSVQFTAQVALESFIPTLPGTGHFWLPTLALSPGNHVQKLLSKPALVLPRPPGSGYPRPQIPLAEATRDLRVCGDAAGAHGGFSTGGSGALTCPPAAAPRGQAAVTATGAQTRARKAHTLKTPAPLTQRGRKAQAQLRASRPLFRYLLDAPAKANCGRHRGVFCLCKLPKVKTLKNASQHQGGDRICDLLLSCQVFLE